MFTCAPAFIPNDASVVLVWTLNSCIASTGGLTPNPFNFGSTLYAPSSRKTFEPSRAPSTLNAKSPLTDPAEPTAEGTAPGISRLSSRKFRPSRGRPETWRWSITVPNDVVSVLIIEGYDLIKLTKSTWVGPPTS